MDGVCRAKEIDREAAAPLIIQLFETQRDICGRALCELVSNHSELAHNDQILQICLWYAVHGEGPELGEPDLESARRKVITLAHFS